MQQNNNALPTAPMADDQAVHEFPVSGASREANSYNQLHWRMPYNPNFFTHEAYGSSSQSVYRPNEPHYQNDAYRFFTPVENSFLRHAGRMLPNQEHNPCKVHDQEFDYFVVIDFEATCDKERKPYPQEIIEFPSVLVSSATGQLESSFRTYVRPTYHQQLTDFCKELTGIQQIQVDNGVLLGEALFMHDKWLEANGVKNKNFAVVTWSDWDCRVMLESECKFKGIEKPPYFDRWIDLRIPFQQKFGGARHKLKDAVKLAGLTWEGRAHCGLDDARNTAQILLLLMQQGTKFSITNSLKLPYQDQQAQGPVEGSHQQFPTATVGHIGEERPNIFCFCGVPSNKCIVRKPGPNLGRSFFGCGNWTPTARAACNFFMWASR